MSAGYAESHNQIRKTGRSPHTYNYKVKYRMKTFCEQSTGRLEDQTGPKIDVVSMRKEADNHGIACPELHSIFNSIYNGVEM